MPAEQNTDQSTEPEPSDLPYDMERVDDVIADKQLRVAIDGSIQRLNALSPSKERALAIIKLQEAVMWLGMDLKRLFDGISCYPEGYNPENATVHPVADGLKL